MEKQDKLWTHFFDMSSGGSTKEKPYSNIYIEAPKEEAIVIFYNRFGHNPHRVSCTCCGADYSIGEWESLDTATKYYRDKQSLNAYLKNKNVLVIYAQDIKEEERKGQVPTQGYVWVE